MSDYTLQLVYRIRKRLFSAIQRITLANILFGLIVTTAVILSTWIVFTAIEAGFWLDTTPRSVLFWVLTAISVGLLGYFIILPLLRYFGIIPGGLSETQTAKVIGEKYPVISDRLVNLLDLAAGRSSEAPAPFVENAVRMLSNQVYEVPFEKVEDFSRPKKASRWLAIPLIALVGILFMAPGPFWKASYRLLSPGVEFPKPAPFQFIVTPGNLEAVKGTSLAISAKTEGRLLPIEAVLELGNLGEEHVDEVLLIPDSTNTFTHLLNNIRTSMRYRFTAGEVTSNWYEINVLERPEINNLQLSLTYPSYTQIPAQKLDPNVGDVTALPGTRVSMSINLSGENISEAYLYFDDSTQVQLNIDGKKATGTFSLRKESTYQVMLKNTQGISNANPVTYTTNVLSDEPPTVSITEPEADINLTESLRTRLRANMTDDFGFSKIQLMYRLTESIEHETMKEFKAIDLPLTQPRTLDQELLHEWLLPESTGIEFKAGDVVEYFIQVRDNNNVAGYQIGRSAIQTLRLPSLTEQYEELEEKNDETEEDIESMLNESKDIQQLFEELRDELRSKPNADWEDQRQLERLQNKKEQLQQQIESLSEQLEDVNEMMEKNDLVNQETLDMFQELEKLVEELKTPELLEALQKLQEAMKEMNLQKMEQAMEEFQFNEEQYKDKLERLKELFEKLRMQQKMEEVQNRLDELAKQEERMAEEMKEMREEQKNEQNNQNQQNQDQNNQNKSEQNQSEQNQKENAEKLEELAKDQKDAQKEMEDIQKEMKEMKEQMENKGGMPEQQMQQMMEQMQEENLSEQMEQNAEQMEELRKQMEEMMKQQEQNPEGGQQQMQQIQQQQQQMQQQLQQMSMQMQMMQQQMNQKQLQVNIEALRRMLDDVLTLSQEQENLRTNSRNLTGDNPILRRLAQQQVELSDGLTIVSDSLKKLSKDIPQMRSEVQIESARALGEMRQAVSQLTDRQISQASGSQKASMTYLNELALLLSDLMEQMQNQQQGAGSMSMQQMMQQMQQMSGQQQQLNQQIQEMLNQMHGNRLSQDQGKRMQQLGQMQQMIRKQLEELNKNPEFRANTLGDLDKVGEEMKETEKEFQNNQITRQTIERQQRILTRLLEAQQSMQQRGREQKREGERAQERAKQNPSAQSPQQRANQLRRDLIRALESGYSSDYQELIKRYFELLQQNKN